jgi:hypothetical protein
MAIHVVMNLKKSKAHAKVRMRAQGSTANTRNSSLPAQLEESSRSAGAIHKPDGCPAEKEQPYERSEPSEVDTTPARPAAFDRTWAGYPVELRVTPTCEVAEAHKAGDKQAMAGESATNPVHPPGDKLSGAGSKQSVPKHFDRIWAGHPIDAPVVRLHINP